MTTPRQKLQAWLTGAFPNSALGEEPEAGIGPGWTLYSASINDGPVALRHIYSAPDDNYPGRRAKDRYEAEVSGLEQYGTTGPAPELIHSEALPRDIGGYAVVSRWIEGVPLASGGVEPQLAERYADSLLEVHSAVVTQKRFSGRPRDLERWWIKVHEQYREMEPLRSGLPPELEAALNKLLQSVAADANAHKRFWQPGGFVPIYGGGQPDVLRTPDNKLVFTNWQFSGLGDPAFELAVAAWTVGNPGEKGREALLLRYLQAKDDDGFNRRVTLALRLWPFGAFLEALEKAQAARETGSAKLLAMARAEAARHLDSTLTAYEWPTASGASLQSDLHLWFVKLRTQMEMSDGQR